MHFSTQSPVRQTMQDTAIIHALNVVDCVGLGVRLGAAEAGARAEAGAAAGIGIGTPAVAAGPRGRPTDPQGGAATPAAGAEAGAAAGAGTGAMLAGAAIAPSGAV